VLTAPEGETGLQRAIDEKPDLILLDIMMPRLDGYAVCAELRRLANPVPILMLTAKGQVEDRVQGLDVGADDYLVKPFSPRVLMARVKALLRRRKQAPGAEAGLIRIHELEINPARHQVLLKGKPVALTITEFRLLHYLAGKPGWVFTRDQIIDAVRGEDYAVTDRSVDVQVVGLRKKLGPAGKAIETVRGVGYRFRE